MEFNRVKFLFLFKGLLFSEQNLIYRKKHEPHHKTRAYNVHIKSCCVSIHDLRAFIKLHTYMCDYVLFFLSFKQ